MPADAVGEAERDLHVAGSRAAADRVDLLGQAVRPPAERVDEVTALAGETGPFGSSFRYQLSAASGPALTRYRVAGPDAGRAEVGPHLGQQRGESSVEADHQPVVAGLGDRPR